MGKVLGELFGSPVTEWEQDPETGEVCRIDFACGCFRWFGRGRGVGYNCGRRYVLRSGGSRTAPW